MVGNMESIAVVVVVVGIALAITAAGAAIADARFWDLFAVAAPLLAGGIIR
jgi:hypothetical protein